MLLNNRALRKKCPYSELFWSTFSRIRTEYGEILRISPYSVRMQENADQNNSEYEHFLRSGSQSLKMLHATNGRGILFDNFPGFGASITNF